MHSAVQDMLERYTCKTTEDYINALKEIIQEIALLGLSRSGFFEKASFYGGTALRIFYNLDRFSEDIDFSLNKEEPDFDISPFCKYIQDELSAYGFDAKVNKKRKRVTTTIESAFIKAGTHIHLITIGVKKDLLSDIQLNQKLKIKIEVDVSPPGIVESDIKYLLLPIPFHVRVFALPALFAGKVHAVLCREWGSGRIKGRDLYDYVWYLSKNITPDFSHLEERMKQTGHIKNTAKIPLEKLKKMLFKKFNTIDYEQAKMDVLPFLKEPDKTALWAREFFKAITEERLR